MKMSVYTAYIWCMYYIKSYCVKNVILVFHIQEDAMMRDVILAIRADEAHHRYVNHTLGTIDKDKPNPFGPGE